MKKLRLCVALAAIIASAGVNATTITFNSTALACSPSYAESGVTFSATDGNGLTSATTPAASAGLISCSVSPFSSLRADFDSLYSGSVSIDLGDYASDQDDLFLELYGSANNLLVSTTQIIADTFTGMVTLTLTAVDIKYAVFGGVGGLGSSVYADNFHFSNDSDPGSGGGGNSVPEPGSLALVGLGLAGLSSLRRRRPVS